MSPERTAQTAAVDAQTGADVSSRRTARIETWQSGAARSGEAPQHVESGTATQATEHGTEQQLSGTERVFSPEEALHNRPTNQCSNESVATHGAQQSEAAACAFDDNSGLQAGIEAGLKATQFSASNMLSADACDSTTPGITLHGVDACTDTCDLAPLVSCSGAATERRAHGVLRVDTAELDRSPLVRTARMHAARISVCRKAVKVRGAAVLLALCIWQNDDAVAA